MPAFRNKLSDTPLYNALDGELFRGVVVNKADPLQRGRAQIRIYGIHTPKKDQSGSEGIPDAHLPWAEQVGPCMGGTSGAGFFAAPTEGSIV